MPRLNPWARFTIVYSVLVLGLGFALWFLDLWLFFPD
jgi:hypothetical protein